MALYPSFANRLGIGPPPHRSPDQGMGGAIGPATYRSYPTRGAMLRQVPDQGMGGAIGPATPVDRPMLRQSPDQSMGGAIGPVTPTERPMLRQVPSQSMGGAIGPASGGLRLGFGPVETASSGAGVSSLDMARPMQRLDAPRSYGDRMGEAMTNPHAELMQRYPWTRWAERSRRLGRADLSRFIPRGFWR